MPTCPAPEQWVVTAAIAIGTFILGQLLPRLWMSKKERKDVEQANYQNSSKLLDTHEAAYRTYASAIAEYRLDPSQPNFVKVATAGDDYFRQARFTCDAVLSDKIDTHHRDNTLLPHFNRVAETTLPEHYEFMIRESKLHGFDYRGELRHDDHRSIYAVVEKFGVGTR
mgnify:CR=1 FL=1